MVAKGNEPARKLLTQAFDQTRLIACCNEAVRRSGQTIVTSQPAAMIAGTPSARQQFARDFTDLYRAAGNPSLRKVALAAQQYLATHAQQTGSSPRISAQRISDWRSGRNVPARSKALDPVLRVLIQRARQRGIDNLELLDLRVWARLRSVACDEPRETPERDPCPGCGNASGGRNPSAANAAPPRCADILQHDTETSPNPDTP